MRVTSTKVAEYIEHFCRLRPVGDGGVMLESGDLALADDEAEALYARLDALWYGMTDEEIDEAERQINDFDWIRKEQSSCA